MNHLDNLPDFLLVEILCRLSCNKLVFQCKCVSKRWCNLISDPYFIRRFLRLQQHEQKPVLGTLITVFVDRSWTTEKLFTTSKHPGLKASNFLSINNFLPCFQAKEGQDQEKSSLINLLASYNDLILCCANFQHEIVYYICNPYTKQWLALPPRAPIKWAVVQAGFVCDPYYHHKKDDIILNGEFYRWKVARIVHIYKAPSFRVEIFSSEIGEWREAVSCQIEPTRGCFCSSGFTNNGLLYWLLRDNSTFEFDPTLTSTTHGGGNLMHKCHFIERPAGLNPLDLVRLSACRGSLRIYAVCISCTSSVWELKEEVDDHHMVLRKFWYRCFTIDCISLKQMVPKNPLISEWINRNSRHMFCLLDFDPNDEDVLYLGLGGGIAEIIAMCNVRERTLEIAIHADEIPPYLYHPRKIVSHPYVLPWWPTPVPKLLALDH